ncbi:MAG: desulfoferrodoxin [bacterium]
MTERFQIYKCGLCENIVEITHAGTGELVCCSQPMNLCLEHRRNEDERANHTPVLERTGQGLMVRVGTNEHPMEPRHYIEWIEVIDEKSACRRFLRPGDAPAALFDTSTTPQRIREYCSQHGLWRGYMIMNSR